MSSSLRRFALPFRVRRFISVAAFDTVIYAFNPKTGLAPTGVSAENAAACIILNSLESYLYPAIHRGVTTVMILVGFIGASDGSNNRGYIDAKNALYFTTYQDAQTGVDEAVLTGNAVSNGLNTTGPITTTGTVTAGHLVISSVDDSSSTSTGAIVVAGGVGVAKNVYIGGTAVVTNATDSSSTATGSMIVAGGVGVAKNMYVGGAAVVTNTTDSSSTTTGSMIVAGGVGVAKNMYVGGTAVVTNATDSSSTTTGSMIVAGGVGVAKNMYVGGTAVVTNTTNASSSSTGSLIVGGGAGVARDMYVGGNIFQASYLLVPTGAIFPYAVGTAPSGYFLCDGSTFSRSTYSVLFAVIGTTYGSGNGTTTYTIPNMNNRMPIGAGGSYTLATTGGSATTTLSTTNLPAHSHTVTDPGHAHTQWTYNDDYNSSDSGGQLPPAWAQDAYPTVDNTKTWTNINSNTTGITVGNTGSGTAFNTISPYIALSYIIKY